MGLNDNPSDRYVDELQAFEEGITACPPATPDCTDCGHTQDLRQTTDGRWLLLDPDPWPTDVVPAGRRWFSTPDGLVLNGQGIDPPSNECRLAHQLVCSRQEPSGHWSDIRVVLWARNRARDGLPYE